MGGSSSIPDRRLVVVAAVCHDPQAPDVLRAAVREARSRGGRVEMVTVWSARDVPDAGRPWGAEREARRRAERAQRGALELVGLPGLVGVEVTGVIVEGDPRELLARASTEAACLVLGAGSAGSATRRVEFLRAVGCPVHRVASGNLDMPGQRVPPQARDLHSGRRR